jgi:hypothetical protein
MKFLCAPHYKCTHSKGAHKRCKHCERRVTCLQTPILEPHFKHYVDSKKKLNPFVCALCDRPALAWLNEREEAEYQKGQRNFWMDGETVGVRVR